MRKRAQFLNALLVGLFVACGGSTPSEPIQAGDTKDYLVEGRVTQADNPSVGIPDVRLLVSTNVLFEYAGAVTDGEGYYSLSVRRRCSSPGISISFITSMAAGYEGTSVRIPCEPLVQTLNVMLEPSE